ncbi:MAG: sigma-70 family RNA polymerase sigma factor [Bacteroidales bacterium]
MIEIYQRDKDGQGQIALGYLYDRYAKQMLNFFYFTLHNDNNKAQDFVHDLFLKIIERHNTFNNNQFFKGWIYRIASNMCKNEFRNIKVIQKYNDHIISTTEPVISNDETEIAVRKCISDLNIEQRSLIVLRFKLKLTVKEIAQIYECPEGTIKSRLFYATKELSKLYKI